MKVFRKRDDRGGSTAFRRTSQHAARIDAVLSGNGRSGARTGELFEGRWENVGTVAQLEALDRVLRSK
jgi:hypothetical protein